MTIYCAVCQQNEFLTESFLNIGIWFLNAIGSALIGILIIWLYQQWRYFRKVRSYFHNKTYGVYHKRFPLEKKMTLTCQTEKNVVYFKGIMHNEEKHKFEGEIVLNIFNLKIGTGFHLQYSEDAFGFDNVIVADSGKTIYVEAPYTATTKNSHGNVDCKIIHQAFVWRRED